MTRPVSDSHLVTGLAALSLAGALCVGAVPVGRVPALGPFLDPVHGVWAVAAHAELPVLESRTLRGLGAGVDVRYDDRGVPHIFAASTEDAARALGFVHARDRLFQMELQTRAAAGTLAELLGPKVLEADREARSLGLAWSAERTSRTLGGTASGRLIAAYADGVNAYIDGMRATDLPLEYRLLAAKPMRWDARYTSYLLARMGLTLAYTEGELRRAEAEALIGKAAVDALFPVNAPIQEPIQPNGHQGPRFDYGKIPPPRPADSTKLAAAEALERAFNPFAADASPDGEIAVGSNNWAVSPKRTAAGHALLAGDPHLTLSLPSVWYEAHIVVPDSLDVYGVTLPGAPAVSIGFNRDVAWSLTNTGADVTDYYVEIVDNPTHPSKYMLDGAWKPLEARVETIHGVRGSVLETDTIYHTHRGPMLRAGGNWISRRWSVLDPTDALQPFRAAATATSAAGVMKAFETFEAPAQNVIASDRGGHIAIRSTGHFPIRAKRAPLGNALLDGTSSANDWQGWLPVADDPQAFDPARGFLSSNNQQPKDPKVDPRYFGWDWATPWRAMRINTLLRLDSAVTPDAMRAFQVDPVSAQTDIFLRAFEHAASTAPAPDDAVDGAARILRHWDGDFTLENERATLYALVLEELNRRTWDELTLPSPIPGGRPRRLETPNSMILAELLDDPTNPWWDDRSTKDVVEDRDTIIRASLAAAYKRAVQLYGPPGEKWAWGYMRHANIHHLLRLPSLSRLDIPMASGPGTLNPSSGDGTEGASWRMVVELGPEVRGWGTYPGGQSGNPASARYDDRLPSWAHGQLDSLRFPHRAADLTGHLLSSTLTLTPAGRQ